MTLSHYFSNLIHHHHSDLRYQTSLLETWPKELVDKPDRFVDKVEVCYAHTMTPGHDGCPPTVNKDHCHGFLRVTVAASESHSEETIFVERVLLQRDGTTHSIIPIPAEALTAPSSTENAFHDHACMILEGSPSALIHAHHLQPNRFVAFDLCKERRLSLLEFATVLEFVSRHGLRAVSLGMDTECETYSAWFCRAVEASLVKATRSSDRWLKCPKYGRESQIAQATGNSVSAWMESTFKAYPAREVATENFRRQWYVMNDEERDKRLRELVTRLQEEELWAFRKPLMNMSAEETAEFKRKADEKLREDQKNLEEMYKRRAMKEKSMASA